MRVLHIYKTYYPDSFGGVENVIYQIAEGALPYGVKCDVLTLAHHSAEGELEYGSHRVYRAKANVVVASTGLSTQYFSLFRALSSEADVIHYHYPWPLMDLAHVLLKPRAPSVLTYHLDVTRQRLMMPIYRPLQRAFFSAVDKVVATSPNYLASSTVLQAYEEKVEIIPLGIDRALYPKVESQLLDGYKGRLPAKFFLFVGVIRYYKGLHILLEAARHADVPIVIAGSGPEEGELKAFAQRHGVNNVIFLGSVSEAEKVALYNLCYALVFPSHLRSEAFGVTLLEAAMYGKPLITAEIGTGTTYVNVHEQTGLVVRPSDPGDLADALKRLWSRPEWVGQLGENARLRYLELFQGQRMVGAYLDLYRRLLSS